MQLEHVFAVFRSGRWWAQMNQHTIRSWQQISHAVEAQRRFLATGHSAKQKSIYSPLLSAAYRATRVLCPIHSRKRLLRAKFGAALCRGISAAGYLLHLVMTEEMPCGVECKITQRRLFTFADHVEAANWMRNSSICDIGYQHLNWLDQQTIFL